jgi:predicted DCC family thiol-disulfide oxidoreductase YuxK
MKNTLQAAPPERAQMMSGDANVILPETGPVVFFDGECALCNGFVKFLVARDRGGLLHYAPLGGSTFEPVKRSHPRLAKIDSLIFHDPRQRDRYHVESSAALLALKTLGGLWRLAAILLVVPPPIRNLVYRFIARNRYRLWGRVDVCDLPSPDVAKRLLP